MSIIDKILIILDDNIEKSLEEIRKNIFNYSKQTINSSIGRLISKGYIVQKNSKYQITTKGQNLITDNLKLIKNFTKRKINKKIYFLMFNIPEKNRINRDVLRIYLKNNGFGRLHNTLWIALNRNINKLNKFIKSLDINSNNIIIFETNLDEKNYNIVIKNTNWDLNQLNKKYLKFINTTKKFISSKNKNITEARFLVYNFSKIIKSDPLLLKEYQDNKYQGFLAYSYYLKIRKYCY